MNTSRWLCLGALLAAVALAPSPASASTPRDAERVLWYLRGQLQLAAAERGWTVQELGCRPRPRGRYVYCWTRVYIPAQRKSFCQNALYRTRGDRIAGAAESAPAPCVKRKGLAS